MIGKPTLLRLHKYLGLTAAALLFVQALTGMTMVFGSELAQAIDHPGMTSGPGTSDASPARLLSVAEARYPDYRADRLVWPALADGTYLVHLDDGRGGKVYLSLDRHDAAILREGRIWRFPVVLALGIHEQWLIGIPGKILVSAAGFLLVFIAASGVALWWPRRGRLGKSLAVQWHLMPRLVLRQLHRTAGTTISVIFLFVAVSGLFIAVPIVLDGAPGRWYSSEPFAPRLEPALAVAKAAVPDRELRDIRMQGPTLIAFFFHAPERNSRAVHRVVVDTRGPRVQSELDAFANQAPWVIALPLHTGEMLGLPGRVLVFVAGLTLAFLASTGPLMWYQARRRAPRKALSQAAAKEQV